jgi:3-hydroxyacyl-[acyl-carrier-protein] dehydratase
MPPPLLIDLARVDVDHTFLTKEQIYELLPQAFEFQVLDGLCHWDAVNAQGVAYADIELDAWWVRGHVPGRPLLPGVLMLEMAAQASAVVARLAGGLVGFVGFGGVDRCKFRETVVPPARLYVLCVAMAVRQRRIVSETQGVIDGRVVFEARITGLMLP